MDRQAYNRLSLIRQQVHFAATVCPCPVLNLVLLAQVPLSLGGRVLVDIAAPAPDFVALAPADSQGSNKYKPMFARLLDLTQGHLRGSLLLPFQSLEAPGSLLLGGEWKFLQ